MSSHVRGLNRGSETITAEVIEALAADFAAPARGRVSRL